MTKLVPPVYTYTSQLSFSAKIWRYGKGYNRPSQCSMVFDTGASMTTLDEKLVRRAGYDLSNAFEATVNGVGKDNIPCRRIMIPYLELGGFDIGPTLVDVIMFSEKSNTTAVLGMNVIRHFTTTIDIDNTDVPFNNPDTPNGSITMQPKFDITDKPVFENFLQKNTRFSIWIIRELSV